MRASWSSRASPPRSRRWPSASGRTRRGSRKGAGRARPTGAERAALGRTRDELRAVRGLVDGFEQEIAAAASPSELDPARWPRKGPTRRHCGAWRRRWAQVLVVVADAAARRPGRVGRGRARERHLAGDVAARCGPTPSKRATDRAGPRSERTRGSGRSARGARTAAKAALGARGRSPGSWRSAGGSVRLGGRSATGTPEGARGPGGLAPFGAPPRRREAQCRASRTRCR